MQRHNLLVITDEIYSELTFEGEHVSIASLPAMIERTVFLHGFSKAYAMTGFRIGYACGPVDIEAMMQFINTRCSARSFARKPLWKPSRTAMPTQPKCESTIGRAAITL